MFYGLGASTHQYSIPHKLSLKEQEMHTDWQRLAKHMLLPEDSTPGYVSYHIAYHLFFACPSGLLLANSSI
jgi:hypothetical protein